MKRADNYLAVGMSEFSKGISSTLSAAVNSLVQGARKIAIGSKIRTGNFEKSVPNSYRNVRRRTSDAQAIRKDYEKIGKGLFKALNEYERKQNYNLSKTGDKVEEELE